VLKLSIHRYTLIGLFTALLVLGGLVAPPAAHAAEAKEEMTISPTDKRYEVNPGETINDSFTILNSGDVPFKFTTYAAPYSVTNTAYNASYEDAPRADAYKWIQIPKVNWSLGVRESAKVPFTISVSKTASPGGHYGIIFAEQQPTESPDVTGFNRKKRLGMIVYVIVKGDVVKSGAVDSILVDAYQSQAPLVAKVRFANDGNVDYLAKSQMTVTTIFGQRVYNVSREVVVLPEKPRDVTMEWKDVSWVGLYKVHVSTDAMGKQVAQDRYVLVAPVWLLIVILLAFTIGVANLVRTRSRRVQLRKRS
jgi:hypothetical protein